QLVRTSRGDIDLEFWQSTCKLRAEYGGDIINGWVAKLFPYLRAFTNGPCNRRNPIFETGEGFTTLVAPSGLSQEAVRRRKAKTGRERRMEAIGGLVGVAQDPLTLALHPKVGWAVCEGENLDMLLERLAKEHATFPGLRQEERTHLPPDLAKFYHPTD